MDSSNDQTLIDELAFSLFVRHGYRLSLTMVELIAESCAANSHPQCRRMAVFWSRVCDAIRQAGKTARIGALPSDRAIRAPSVDPSSELAALSPMDRYVGYRLGLRRQEVGLPLCVLARSLGLSPGELKQIEAGQMRLGAVKLRVAMQLLGVDVAYFFHGYPGPVDDSADDEDPSLH
jgi:hypothetical protein